MGEFFSLIDQALVDVRQASGDDIPLPQIVASEPEPAQAEEIFALAVIEDADVQSPAEQQKKAAKLFHVGVITQCSQ